MDLLPDWYFLAVYTLLGLGIGSFLNVLIVRLPEGESIRTRSHCPGCGSQVRNRDNIPVISWLLLRGKCRDCQMRIPVRYPLTEAGTAMFFGGLVWHFQMRLPGVMVGVLLVFAAASVALSVIDFRTQTLPDRIVAPLFAVTAAGVLAQAVLSSNWERAITAYGAGVGYLTFYFAMWFFTRGRGLGYGDVKLSPSLGMLTGMFGAAAAVIGFVSAFIVAGVPLGVLMAAGVLKRGTRVPFGPFLIAGAWIGILAGAPLSEFYLRVAGLS